MFDKHTYKQVIKTQAQTHVIETYIKHIRLKKIYIYINIFYIYLCCINIFV